MGNELTVRIQEPKSISVRSQFDWKQTQKDLESQNVPGADFLGWLDWPLEIPDDLIHEIEEVAEEIRERADLFVSAGIGGSYLGGRAVIEALGGQKDGPEIRYAGYHLSGPQHRRLLEDLEDQSVYVNVISKSGTTTETALAFRLLRNHLTEHWDEDEVARRVIATTDAQEGALVEASKEAGYRRFVIPDDIGGRYSVLTPVGLLPIAVAGINIRALLQGAGEMRERVQLESESPAIQYADWRNQLYEQDKSIEVFSSFYPELGYMGKWWQQLFGESEGKQGKGLYPDTLDFTTDLHSMGQYIQQGPRMMFETIPVIEDRPERPRVKKDPENLDGLNYLSGHTLEKINREALEATIEAHVDGDVPVIRVEIPRLNAHYLGQILYLFMYSCGLSALKLGVNPFNQPGVEAYKNNMYRRLGRPGYE